MINSSESGKLGEKYAAEFLAANGFTILVRNFRCRLGEIDIIAADKKFIAFVEVKLRKNSRYGEAKEYVTLSKQRRIILTAQFWLAGHNTQLQPRFDVVEIYAPNGPHNQISINYIEDAFQL